MDWRPLKRMSFAPLGAVGFVECLASFGAAIRWRLADGSMDDDSKTLAARLGRRGRKKVLRCWPLGRASVVEEVVLIGGKGIWTPLSEN